MNEVFRLIKLARAKHELGTMEHQDVVNIAVALDLETLRIQRQIEQMKPELDRFEMRKQRQTCEKILVELASIRKEIVDL